MAKKQGGTATAEKPHTKEHQVKQEDQQVDPVSGRPILYPDFQSVDYVGDNALSTVKTEEYPNEGGFVGHLLGLTYDEAFAKQRGAEAPAFIDRNKKPVYCLNNLTNRPVNFGRVEDLVQEIKFSGPAKPVEQRRWQFNSEPIIIGRTGMVINGQKQLIACYLAEQDRTGPQKLAWEFLGWTRSDKDGNTVGVPVQIDKVVNFGVSEAEEVIDTVDVAQPRSLADVIYRSEHFSKFKPEARKTVARMADFAIRMLWDRTGAGYKPKKGAGQATAAPRRTMPESMDFLRRHGRLLEAIKHVYEEYGKDEKLKINKELMSPGYAAALLYLMGTSASEDERNGLGQIIDYAEANPAPNESVLNFDYWDGAKAFWNCLARMPVDGNVVCPNFQVILETISAIQPPMGQARVALGDRIAVLSLAWSQFVVGNEFKRAEITPEWVFDDAGNKKLKESYAIGGIDLGHAPEVESEGESAAVERAEDSTVLLGDSDEPTPEQQAAIENAKAKIDSEKVAMVQQKLREAAEKRRVAAANKA